MFHAELEMFIIFLHTNDTNYPTLSIIKSSPTWSSRITVSQSQKSL